MISFNIAESNSQLIKGACYLIFKILEILLVWDFFLIKYHVFFSEDKFTFEKVGEKWDTLLHTPRLHHTDGVDWDTPNHSSHDETSPVIPHMPTIALCRLYKLATSRRRQPPIVSRRKWQPPPPLLSGAALPIEATLVARLLVTLTRQSITKSPMML